MKRLLKKHSTAFTLMEALLASSILAMAITAITMPFSAGAQNEQANARNTLAAALAQEMMEEVLSKPFADPDDEDARELGPESDEVGRSSYDNMDDYHGYVEPEGMVKDMQGQAIDSPAATGLSRRVSVSYVYVSGQSSDQEPTFVRVEVQVFYCGTETIKLTRLVYKNG
ncbi:MAG: hypothetical protein ACLFVU_06130 [Phycisphaerae bacterium]